MEFTVALDAETLTGTTLTLATAAFSQVGCPSQRATDKQ
jgi:hypothetical protein